MDSALSRIMKEQLRPLAAVTLTLLLVTSVAYPLAVTGIGQALFSRQANGSIITVSGKEVGSSLIGQTFSAARYFHSRPSAAGSGYDAANSSGSNLGPTSDKLINGVADDPATADVDESFAGLTQRIQQYRTENGLSQDVRIPADAVTASASGLDPHISPANARLQVARVARARGVSETDIGKLVDEYTEDPALAIIGQPRVNVLKLNVALDNRYPTPK